MALLGCFCANACTFTQASNLEGFVTTSRMPSPCRQAKNIVISDVHQDQQTCPEGTIEGHSTNRMYLHCPKQVDQNCNGRRSIRL